MNRFSLLLLFSAACTTAIAQDMKPIPERQQLIKISDLGTLIEPIVHTIANRGWHSKYIGIGIHYEKLLTNRLSLTAGGSYFKRASFITLQSSTQPAFTVRTGEKYGASIQTGVRTYFRKNKFNHHNGFFTGGYVAYTYHNINTINHLNMLHAGIPLGYQHKFSNKFTAEFELINGYGLFTQLMHRPAGRPATEHITPKRYNSIHIALGYVF